MVYFVCIFPSFRVFCIKVSLSQDRVYENLSFRANVIGYLKACVLYVANGYQWEPEIEDFIRWSERYDLYCKMRFFGDAIKKAERDGDQESKKGPASILTFLPDKFSYQQVETLRLKNDMNAKLIKGIFLGKYLAGSKESSTFAPA